jgi:hypothetical protein
MPKSLLFHPERAVVVDVCSILPMSATPESDNRCRWGVGVIGSNLDMDASFRREEQR